MKLDIINDTNLVLYLTTKELSTLAACLRETIALLPPEEYSLRTGSTAQEISKIAREVNLLMEEKDIEIG